jgi:hypothetical protein
LRGFLGKLGSGRDPHDQDIDRLPDQPPDDLLRALPIAVGEPGFKLDIPALDIAEPGQASRRYSTWSAAACDCQLTKPSFAILGCCARAASGHAAAPPTTVMNWRRLIDLPRSRKLSVFESVSQREFGSKSQ